MEGVDHLKLRAVMSKRETLKANKIYFLSGIDKPSGVTNKKRAFGVDDAADFEKSKKHRLEEDVVSCTQHFLPTDLSADDEVGSIKEERSAGLLKNFKEPSNRRRRSGLPSMFTPMEIAQLELTPGGGVIRCGADADLMSTMQPTGVEGHVPILRMS